MNNIRIQIKNKENVCQSQFAQNEHFRNILTFYAGKEKQIFELLVVSSTEKFDTFLAIISLMANKLANKYLTPTFTAKLGCGGFHYRIFHLLKFHYRAFHYQNF